MPRLVTINFCYKIKQQLAQSKRSGKFLRSAQYLIILKTVDPALCFFHPHGDLFSLNLFESAIILNLNGCDIAIWF